MDKVLADVLVNLFVELWRYLDETQKEEEHAQEQRQGDQDDRCQTHFDGQIEGQKKELN